VFTLLYPASQFVESHDKCSRK